MGQPYSSLIVLARGEDLDAPLENDAPWDFLALSRWEGQPSPLIVGNHTTCIGTFQPVSSRDKSGAQAHGRWRVELHQDQTTLDLTEQLITPSAELPLNTKETQESSTCPFSWALLPGSVLNSYAPDGKTYPHVMMLARPWNLEVDPLVFNRIISTAWGLKSAFSKESPSTVLIVSLVGIYPVVPAASPLSRPELPIWYDGPLGVLRCDTDQSIFWLAYYPGGGSALLTLPAPLVSPNFSPKEGATLEEWLLLEKSWAVKHRCLISFLAYQYCSFLETSLLHEKLPTITNSISVVMEQSDFHVRAAVVLVLLCQGAPESILHIQVIPTPTSQEAAPQRNWHPEPLWRKFFHHLGAHVKSVVGSKSPPAVPITHLQRCLESLTSQDLNALISLLNQRSMLIPQRWTEQLSDLSPQGPYEQP